MRTWFVLLLMTFLAACGGAPAAVSSSSAVSAPNAIAPASPPPALPATAAPSPPPSPSTQNPAPTATAAQSAPTFGRGTVTIQTKTAPVTLPVEIADNEARREYGLMNRSSLAPDAGMVFVFQPPADAKQVGFWMKDTLIPLSIAFVEPNLVIESIQDMQALSQDVHYAPRNYAYAIEANLGFFAKNGVAVGDLVSIRQG